MKRNTFILMLTTGILIFAVFGCDLFLAPPNARENPNDPANPTPGVFDFGAFGSGPNSVMLKWQFNPEDDTDADVLIIRNSAAEPTGVNDGSVVYEGRPDISEDGFFYVPDESAELDGDYFYAIWSFTGTEDDRLYNGPIVDEATTKLQVADVPPMSDGYVWGDGGTSTSKDFTMSYMDLQYNPGSNEYYILLDFNFDEAPDFGAINRADLRLYFDYSMLAAIIWDVHARRITTDWNEGETAADLYNKITSGFYDPVSGSSIQINSDFYDYYYWPVQDIIEDWLTGQQPDYGIIVNTDTIGSDYFEFSSTEGSWEWMPVIELEYYGDPPPEEPPTGNPPPVTAYMTIR